MLIEQVQEILATLSLAFENLLESSTSFSTVATVSRPSSPVSISESFLTGKANRPARVKKFQRPSRRLQSKTPSPSTSPLPFEASSSHKRSWDSEAVDEGDGNEDQFEEFEHNGKRSKSVVLLQELEALRVSSPPSPLDSELVLLAEQEFSFNLENSIFSLKNLQVFDDVLAELEALNAIDDVFEALMSVKVAVLQQNREKLTGWCKWRLLSRTFESFERVPFKSCLSQCIGLCRAVNYISDALDWRDPELSFLLFKGLTQLLAKQRPIDSKSVHFMRKLDEFAGLIRVLTLSCTLLWNRPLRSVMQFLAQKAQQQLSEFFEQLLEAALNLFELCSLLNSNLALSRTFVLIFVHFGRLFVPQAATTTTLLERVRKCKLIE